MSAPAGPPTESFRARVAAAQRDERVIRAVHLATLRKVEQRADGMAQLRDAEGLRTLAARIKQHTLDQLPDYLEQFTRNARAAGAHVHFASDAAAAQGRIVSIARERGLKLAVKAKSMTTEEIHLNDALEQAGVRTVETDLGEFIVQIDRDRPSHIVTPIIHKDRQAVARAMQRELGCEYTEDPVALTQIARRHLRDVFRRCDLGITGVNFGIAASGAIALCTNEGNGRMSITRPRVHVALMGVEKLIPRTRDLAVFLKLLSRSSTGQPLTVYTTLLRGPRRADELDGPEELHIVLLDNGRSRLLGGELQSVLRCIRCGACLNACPVYRNIGGHAYASVYPGPIGALITPLLRGMSGHEDLPRASSLCGACEAACPVRIDIPLILAKLRAASPGFVPRDKRFALAVWNWFMRSPRRYRWAQWLLQRTLRPDGDGWTRHGPGPLWAWTESRDLPPLPKQSFRERWQRELRGRR